MYKNKYNDNMPQVTLSAEVVQGILTDLGFPQPERWTETLDIPNGISYENWIYRVARSRGWCLPDEEQEMPYIPSPLFTYVPKQHTPNEILGREGAHPAFPAKITIFKKRLN